MLPKTAEIFYNRVTRRLSRMEPSATLTLYSALLKLVAHVEGYDKSFDLRELWSRFLSMERDVSEQTRLCFGCAMMGLCFIGFFQVPKTESHRKVASKRALFGARVWAKRVE